MAVIFIKVFLISSGCGAATLATPFHSSKNLFTLILFLTIGISEPKAQHSRIDSLVKLTHLSSGVVLSDVMLEISDEYFIENNPLAITWADSAAMVPGLDSLSVIQAIRISCVTRSLMARYDELLPRAEYGIKLCERHGFKKEAARFLTTIANVHTLNGQYTLALKTHFDALAIRRELGDSLELFFSYSNVGVLLYKIRDYENALSYYQRSMQFLKSEQHLPFKRTLFVNMSLCSFYLFDYENGFKYVSNALELNKASNYSPSITMEANFSLGVGFLQMGDYNRAYSAFHQSQKEAETLGNSRFIADNLLYRSKSISSLDRIEAKRLLVEAENIATRDRYDETLLNILKERIKLSQIDQNHDREITTLQKRYIETKNRMYSARLSKNLATIETSFLEATYHQTKERQKALIAARKDQISKKQIEGTFQGAFVCLLLILLIGVIRIFVQRKNQSRVLKLLVAKRTYYLNKKDQQLNNGIKTALKIKERSNTHINRCLEILNCARPDYLRP